MGKLLFRIVFRAIVAPLYLLWLIIAAIPVTIYWAFNAYEKNLTWWQTLKEWQNDD